MSIQSNVNQTLSLAALLLSQSPMAKYKKEGLDIQGRQEQAVRGLKDIEGNVDRAFITQKLESLNIDPEHAKYLTPEALREYINPQNEGEEMALKVFQEKGAKKYNLEELEDIEARTRTHQSDIYSAKTAALNPQLGKYINASEIRQPDLTKTLSNIRAKTAASKEALLARQEEARPSKDFVKTVMGEDAFSINKTKGGV